MGVIDKMKRWKILDYGDVDRATAREIEYGCEACLNESIMPVHGLPMAQIGMGIVFDVGHHAIPVKIRCPHCGSTYET